ncbi:MAG: calcium-binding protein [Microcoleaceae cyanobacterium]
MANTPTRANDFLQGDAFDNRIDALEGNDTVFGFGGNDTLVGNQGIDRLLGGPGNDRLYGGRGPDNPSGGGGVFGGSGNDTLFGDTADDFLSGDNGIDSLIGGQGADTFFGIAGDQTDLDAGEGDVEIPGMAAFSGGNSLNSETSLFDTAEESPAFAELRREGYDLLINISGEQEFSSRRTNAAIDIGDPYAVLGSIKFLNDEDLSYLLNISESGEAEAPPNNEQSISSAPFIDPLGGRPADVESLTQYLEELETSGADQEQIEYVRDTLLETQRVEAELARIDEKIAARTVEADFSLLPEQVILIEEGTFIPAEFQPKIMGMGIGSEVLTLPEGYFEEFFTPTDFEFF